MSAAAYAAAQSYAQTAIDLLAADGWQAHYPLMLNVHELAAEAAYLNVDFAQSEQYIATLLTSAQTLLDAVPAHLTQIRIRHAQNRMQEAIDLGLVVMGKLGFALQEEPPAGMSTQAVQALPPMVDARARAAVETLDAFFVSVFVARPDLFPPVVFTIQHLSLEFGLHPVTILGLCVHGVFAWYQDIEVAYNTVSSALELVDELEARRYLCMVRAIMGGYLMPWKNHLREAKQFLWSTVEVGLETGDRTYTASALSDGCYLEVLLGRPLDQAQKNMEQSLRVLRAIGEQSTQYDAAIWTQFVINLRGLADDPLRFEGPAFYEDQDLTTAQAAGLHHTLHYNYLLRLILNYHWGEYDSAYAFSTQAEPFVPALMSLLTLPLLPYYQSLAVLRLLEQQAERTAKLKHNLESLQLWAHHAPMNYRHKLDLVLAEQMRVAGDLGMAIDHYEQAIAGAREHGFLHEEALAYELLGRFWHERGNDIFASANLREAHTLYSRWGAVAIAAHLEEQYPRWLQIGASEVRAPSTIISAPDLQMGVDLYSLMMASETIAGEVVLERLLGKMMTIIMENAGAQRGCLLLEQDAQWVIQAEGNIEQAGPQVMQATGIAGSGQLSEAIVRYVIRTQETLVLGNAAQEGAFTQDAYIRRHQSKSLLCVPLISQGSVSGILYLENNLAADAFAPQRVALLRLLSSQMAISLNNARLYADLEGRVAERTAELHQQIAERTSAEQRMREERDRAQSYFDIAGAIMLIIAPDQTVTLVNRRECEILGYEREEILGKNWFDSFVPARARDRMRAVLEEVLAGEAESVEYDESPIQTRSGAERIIAWHNSVLRGTGGRIIGTLSSGEDITEHKQAESALQKAHDELETLLDASYDLCSVSELPGLFNRALRHLNGVVDFGRAGVMLAAKNGLLLTHSFYVPDGPSGLTTVQIPVSRLPAFQRIFDQAEPVYVPDIQVEGASLEAFGEAADEIWADARAGMRSWLGAPLVVRDRVIGILSLLHAEPDRYGASIQSLVQTFANQLAIAVDNVQLYAQAQEAAAVAERTRLARELHDSVTQSLYSITLHTDATLLVLSAGKTRVVKERLERLNEQARDAMTEMRLLVYQLRPSILEETGLVGALEARLQAVEARSGLATDLQVVGERRLPRGVEGELFWVALEGLINALKHAQASKVRLQLVMDDEIVRLVVQDNGIGFEVDSAVYRSGYGLTTMEERMEQLGGRLEIDSAPGSGTTLRAEVNV